VKYSNRAGHSHPSMSRCGMIPIPTILCSPPLKPILVTRKRRTGEDQREPVLRVRDVSNNTINPGIGAGDEGLLHQSNASIIENPHAMVIVR
jgi:hypothetical protein